MALQPRDRAFTYKLATVVLRRLGQIDALIDDCLATPLPARLSPVRNLLRLGVVQLLFLATPPHAAVNTTVALARALRYTGQAPMINAILRRLAREGAERVAKQDAERLNTPGWLWQSWVAAYGEARTRAIAATHLAEPPLDLTVKPEVDAGRLAAELGAVQLPTGSLRLAHAGDVSALAGFAEGEWWVQDAAAAFPVRLLGNVRDKLVFDLCAAPGGKTAQLAATGARVIAVDRAPARLRRLKENLRRLSLHAEIIEADVSSWQPEAPADAVLLDAPCSATGTIRRHPDVARLKSPGEVRSLAGVQRRLLVAALRMLKPGGSLVYCACSLQPEEGIEVVDSLIAEGLPVRKVPAFAAEFEGWDEFLTTAGDLRTLPCHLDGAGGMDGFFASRLRRS
jgi:16S rRNA (cytosine967-C5)-methyltransferase